MTALIAQPASEPSVWGMWGLIAVPVAAALAWSIVVILRARRLDARVDDVIADGERVILGFDGSRRDDAVVFAVVERPDFEDEQVELHPWSDPEHDVGADIRRWANARPTGPARWSNPIIGYDDEMTPVHLSDVIDGNIDLDDVITHGGVYGG